MKFSGRLIFTSAYFNERWDSDDQIFIHMDDPSDEILTARAEGFLTRTRINMPTVSNKLRYQKSMDTGTSICSFVRD